MSARWLVALLPALALGCSERPLPEPIPEDVAQRYATAICASAQTCGCGLFESATACEAFVIAEFEAVEGKLRGFDEACFDAFMTSGAYESCVDPTQVKALFPECAAFYGEASEGESCLSNYLFTPMNPTGTCTEGVSCYFITGVCSNDPPIPPFKSEGDPCSEELANNCVWGGLFCHEGICQQRATLGEPCVDGVGCELGFCQGLSEDGEGVCTLWLDHGDPCDPKDYRACKAPPEGGYDWCSPATQRCEDTIPHMCSTLQAALGPPPY